MLTSFILNTINFVIHVLIAFSAIIMGWLVWDSGEMQKQKKAKFINKIHSIGFFAISIFLLSEQGLELSLTLQATLNAIFISGLYLITIGLYFEPTPQIAEKSGKAEMLYNPSKLLTAALGILPIFSITALIGKISNNDIMEGFFFYNDFIAFTLILFILMLLGVKYGPGIQKQYKSELFAFFFFAVAYLIINIGHYILGTDPRFVEITQNFGTFWAFEKIALVIGFGYLAKHAISFLRFRLKPQLFLGFITYSLIIFFSVTLAFLLILLQDFQKNTLFNLKASTSAIELSLIKTRNSTILTAKALANNETIINGVYAENHDAIAEATQELLQLSNSDFILITNEAGLSIYDTNDTETTRINYSAKKLLVEALNGEARNTFTIKEGVISKKIIAETNMPIVKDGRIIGAISVGSIIDNQLIDAIKKKTSLELTIFAGDERVATTFATEDGKNRLIGTTENNKKILEKVLKNGETFEGVVEIFNIEHLAVYTPLIDDKEKIIGMVFVGEPSKILAAIADDSIKSTLKMLTLLVVLSLIPTYFIIKKISENQNI